MSAIVRIICSYGGGGLVENALHFNQRLNFSASRSKPHGKIQLENLIVTAADGYSSRMFQFLLFCWCSPAVRGTCLAKERSPRVMRCCRHLDLEMIDGHQTDQADDRTFESKTSECFIGKQNFAQRLQDTFS